MRLTNRVVAMGLAAGLTAGGCGEGESSPAAVMHVNCQRVPGDAYTLSLNALDVPHGTEEVEIAVTDQEARITLQVRLLGGLAVNGDEIVSSDAGDTIEQLPSAQLIAGVPAPGREEFYAGDEGLTLACNGASIPDIRLNRSGG